jgi:hypothetical protein
MNYKKILNELVVRASLKLYEEKPSRADTWPPFNYLCFIVIT